MFSVPENLREHQSGCLGYIECHSCFPDVFRLGPASDGFGSPRKSTEVPPQIQQNKMTVEISGFLQNPRLGTTRGKVCIKCPKLSVFILDSFLEQKQQKDTPFIFMCVEFSLGIMESHFLIRILHLSPV